MVHVGEHQQVAEGVRCKLLREGRAIDSREIEDHGCTFSRLGPGRYDIELGVEPNEFVNPYFSFAPHDVSSYGVRERADRLVPAGTDLNCFNLDIEMEPTEREDRVAAVIALVIPYLLQWSTLDGLTLLAADPARQFIVHSALKRWLCVPLPPLRPYARNLDYENPLPLATRRPSP